MNKIFFVAIICFTYICFISCRDNGITGKLHGKWQLKTVEENGKIVPVDSVWYNFQSGSLFMYQIYWAEKDTFMHWYGFRVQEGNKMDLEFIYNPDIPLSAFLPYTDWDDGKRSFIIDQLTGKTLKLISDEKIYAFRKFE